MIDYYELLQVHIKASPEIIKKAYRTLLLEMNNHPDLGGSSERTKQLNEAYATLSNPDRRREYDRSRRVGTIGGTRPLDSVIVPCPSCATKNRVKSLANLRLAKCSRCGARLTPASDRAATRDWSEWIWSALPQRTCPSCQHQTRLLDKRCPRCGHAFGRKAIAGGLHRQPVLWFAIAGAAVAVLAALYWPMVVGVVSQALPGNHAAEDALVTAKRLTAEGHTAGAVRAWQDVLKTNPTDAEAAAALGKLYLKQGDSRLAVQYLKQAVTARPELAAWHFALASAYSKAGNRPEAIRHFRRVIELEPKAGAAHFNLGYLLQAEGDMDGAEQAYRTASELEPDRSDALVNLGVLLVKRNQPGDAAISFQSALKRHRDDAEAHYNLGLVFETAGQTDIAGKHLEQSARLYLAQGQTEKAKTIRDKVLRLRALHDGQPLALPAQ
ncbi:MAG: tetratricopeptide repeat protein [Candidatus Sericytochromatia bacterium]|nr:tetratricopeptide repeat protein [Candidatus Sericytochromatia bacterium]